MRKLALCFARLFSYESPACGRKFIVSRSSAKLESLPPDDEEAREFSRF
jgi:hypothetical protein